MNKLQMKMAEKRTENFDVAYTTTGKSLTDLLFAAEYYTKNLDEVSIGNSPKEKLFSLFVRDPRFGQGYRDLGRRLMAMSGVSPELIVLAGRYDDLWKNPTNENLAYLKEQVFAGNELAKKWMPRLNSKDGDIARLLAQEWGLSEKKYRKLIKVETVEHQLSYALPIFDDNPLADLFGASEYEHPLWDEINFENVPSLAMTKYVNTFLRNDELRPRFKAYIKEVMEGKAKVNTATANVHTAYKTVQTASEEASQAADIIGKKIVEQEEAGVEINAIVILDTSGSMGWGYGNSRPIDKANSVANSLASMSTYAKDYVVSFSSRPQLLKVKGNTLKERYQSMYTGDISNTDFAAVMKLLKGLQKYPEYIIVISDMEFDQGSSMSKDDTMRHFREIGANTRIIWWNINDRHKTVPEMDIYGNYYLSGFNLSALSIASLFSNMDEYLDGLLAEYHKKVLKGIEL